MLRIFGSFLSKLEELIADSALDNVKSIKEFELTLKSLQKNWKSLSAKASDVKEEIENAEASGQKKRKREVDEWLKEVELIETEVVELEREVESTGFISRLMRGGKAEQLNNQVDKLVEQSRHFSELLLDVRGSRGVSLLTTTMVGEAFTENMENILRHLKSGNVSSIGVHLESCSDSSNDEIGDSSIGLIADNSYTISPSGSLRSNITSWQKGDFLGRGSFGTVYEGFTDDGLFFAVMEVSLLDQGSQGQQSIYQLEQEILRLRQFQHDNIVRYLGTDKDDGKLYIFLELGTKGSLLKLYETYQLYDSQASSYTRQILSGLNYLHSRNVVHRDIKCANILVDVSGSVKLADFGLAKVTKLNDIKSCKGTAFWMAPEVVRQRNGYGRAADIWSLGCTVLEMLTRQIPYAHMEGMQALFRIGSGELPPIPNTLSRDAQDFILKCLQVDPHNRPSAAQLLEHPFVKKCHESHR